MSKLRAGPTAYCDVACLLAVTMPCKSSWHRASYKDMSMSICQGDPQVLIPIREDSMKTVHWGGTSGGNPV